MSQHLHVMLAVAASLILEAPEFGTLSLLSYRNEYVGFKTVDNNKAYMFLNMTQFASAI